MSKPRKRRRRPGVLYEAWGYDPYALIHRDLLGRLAPRIKIIRLYIGQTRQAPESRWRQHMNGFRFNGVCQAAQPWADTVTEWRVVYHQERVSDSWLDFREGLRVANRRPPYNILLNKGNRKRIPPWEAQRLRRERDRLGGVEKLVVMAQDPAEVGIRLDEGRITQWYGSWFEKASAE